MSDLLKGNVLGSCDCRDCGYTGADEIKVVCAGVRYPMGYGPVSAIPTISGAAPIAMGISFPEILQHGSGFWDVSGRDSMPDSCYRTYLEEAFNSSGQLLWQNATTYDLNGGISSSTIDNRGTYDDDIGGGYTLVLVSPTEIQQVFANGSRAVWRVADVYTYTEAYAAAVNLLAEGAVDMLNPAATYAASEIGITTFNSFTGAYLLGHDVHFCYPFEAVAAGYSGSSDPFYTNSIFIVRHYDGTIHYCPSLPAPFGLWPTGFPGLLGYADSNGPKPWAASGMSFGAGPGSNGFGCTFDGWIWVSKLAYVSERGLNRRQDILLDIATGSLIDEGDFVQSFGDGENLFYYSDAPTGYSIWKNIPELPATPSAPAGAGDDQSGAGDAATGAGGNENAANL